MGILDEVDEGQKPGEESTMMILITMNPTTTTLDQQGA